MEEFEKFKVDSEKLKANIEELKAAMERTIDEAGSYRESKDSLDAVNNKLNGLINGIDELVASSTKFMEEGKDLIYKIDGLEKAFRNERQVNLASKMDLLHEDMCSLKDDFREELNINTVPQIKETIKEVINSEESLIKEFGIDLIGYIENNIISRLDDLQDNIKSKTEEINDRLAEVGESLVSKISCIDNKFTEVGDSLTSKISRMDTELIEVKRSLQKESRINRAITICTSCVSVAVMVCLLVLR